MHDKLVLKEEQVETMVREVMEEFLGSHVKTIKEGFVWYDEALKRGYEDGSADKGANVRFTSGRMGARAKKGYEEGYKRGMQNWLANQPRKR